MASIILDWIARRRVAREEAAVRALADAVAHQSGDMSGVDTCFASDHAAATVAQGARVDGSALPADRYVPRCCWDGLESLAPSAHPIQVIRDVVYSAGGGADTAEARAQSQAHRRHRLDIYFSPAALRMRMRLHGAHSVPVAVHVHGGGWQRGDKANEWRGGPNAGRAAARHGMVACVVSYRLARPSRAAQVVWAAVLTLLLCTIASACSAWVRDAFLLRWGQSLCLFLLLLVIHRVYDRSHVQHPHSVLDVALAVAWVRAHLTTLVPEADPTRLFLSGHSAGAHLVSLLATDARYLDAVGLGPRPAAVLRGVCAVSGIYNLHSPVHAEPGAMRNRFFRAVYGAPAFGASKAALDDASPLVHASSSAPPFLLISAASDLGLEVDAARFAARLAALDVPVHHHVVVDTSHSTIASHFEQHAAHRHLFDFIHNCCAREATEVREQKLRDSAADLQAHSQAQSQQQQQQPSSALALSIITPVPARARKRRGSTTSSPGGKLIRTPTHSSKKKKSSRRNNVKRE